MTRRSGGFRGAKPTWTTTSTSGIFGMEDVVDLKAAGQWPRGPVAPTSLAGTGGDQQVALTWVAPATMHGTVTAYVVEYTPFAGSPTVVATGSTAASYTLTGLTNGTEYTFRVAAVNHTRGDWSDSVAVTAGVPAVPAPLAYFRMEEASGTRASQVGGYSLTSQSFGASQAVGIIGNSASFSNDGGCLTGPSLPPSGSTSGSVSVWIYPTDSGRPQQIFGDFFRAPITISLNSSNGANAALGKTLETSYSSGLSVNQWHHLVAVWDGAAKTITLYVNGSQSQQGSYSTASPSFNSVTVGAYEDGSANRYGGRIDELGIWDSALSSAAVAAIYNSGSGFDPTA